MALCSESTGREKDLWVLGDGVSMNVMQSTIVE